MTTTERTEFDADAAEPSFAGHAQSPTWSRTASRSFG